MTTNLLTRLIAAGPKLTERALPRTGLIAAVVLSLGLVGFFVLGAPVPQLIFGHDLVFMLDGAYKWNAGFLPHADYYAPTSFLIPALIAWGANLSGSYAHAMPAAMCLFALALLPAALYSTFSRLRPWLAALTTVMLVASVLAPHQLRFPSSALTYCTIYNRWGYAIFCLAALVVIVPPATVRPRLEFVDGLIAGACVALAMSVKVTFGTLAFLLFVSWIFVQPRTRAFYAGGLIAGLAGLVFFGFMTRWGFAQYAADISLAFRARKGLGFSEALDGARYLYPDLCAVAALAALWFASGRSRPDLSGLLRTWRIGLTLACFSLSAIAILISNAPAGNLRESPVLSLGAIVLLAGVLREVQPNLSSPDWKPRLSRGVVIAFSVMLLFGVGARWGTTSNRVLLALAVFAGIWHVVERVNAKPSPGWLKAFACVAMLLVVTPVTARNVDGLLEATKFKLGRKSLPPDQRFDSGGLAGVEIRAFGGDPPLPTTYIGKVEDGLALLQATGNADKPVHALEFANPFNLARQVPPSRSGVTCWQIDFVYSFGVAPPPERVFTPGEPVLLPKRFGDGDHRNITALLHHYGCYLEEHYAPAVESQQWYLYVPKEQATERSVASAGLAR